MSEIRKTTKGVEYAEVRSLQTKTHVETQAHLYRVPHSDPDVVDLALRIGRYKRVTQKPDVPEPKSALTLNNIELEALVDYLSECYGPIRDRAQRYIPLGEELGDSEIDDLRRLFNDSDKSVLVELLTTHQVIPAGLLDVVEMCHRRDAVSRFEAMLDEDLPEADWQAWFAANPWVLGTEFVEILNERAIDTGNITDYLMRAYDGFVDVVEIKRPGGGLRFWAPRKDHENLYPHMDLVKALTQTMNYLTELEFEANSHKFIERVGARVLKPRGILVFGRSLEWGDEELRARRVLSSSFHNMTILTYDDVLERAKRMLHDTVVEETGASASADNVSEDSDWNAPF